MIVNRTQTMPNANNITITTELSSCDNTSFSLNQTAYDLYNIYQSNISNLFFNVSINHFNCSNGNENYFEQIIFFTQAVSIRIQILFASTYFDYIKTTNYRLNGFIIDQEKDFNLSSITINDTTKSDACSSGEAAQDPLCLTNLTNPICTLLSNPWNFTCSQKLITSTSSLSIVNNSLLDTTKISPSLNSWQIALICILSICFVLLLICLTGFFYRRYTHSKQLALSHVNLFGDFKLMQKSEIPQGQAFQRATILVQPKRSNTAISWIHDANNNHNDENYINLKAPESSNQVTFIDYTKVNDSGFSSKPIICPVNTKISPVISTTNVSRSISEISMNQIKGSMTGLEEDKVNESDNISLDRSNLTIPKKPSESILRQFSNVSSIDESLHDEDAWMSILDVVNAELAVLNEEDLIRTVI